MCMIWWLLLRGGTGSRVRTATQSISVTVVDVVEGGSNSNPVFSSSSSFSVNENVRRVGTVVAVDNDAEDSIRVYSIRGVADVSFFGIDLFTGALSFRSARNYEDPQDSGRNNVYDLVVEVTSGTGNRVRTATQSITVTVDDVDEVPSTPSAPVLSSSTSTSLSVSWSAPSNTGPVISDYDVKYRQGTSGSFSDWVHAGNSTSTTIASLSANYFV